MRTLKIMLTILVVCSITVLSLSCASKSDSAVLENQIVTVQRGDLVIDITAAGNLALSRTENLAFEMSGTVEEVLIEEGESVEEGQVLAKLDTSEWEDHILALEDKVIAAERNVPAKERAVPAAERKVTDAERKVTEVERKVTEVERDVTNVTYVERQVKAKELALLQAKVDLNKAKDARRKANMESSSLEISVEKLKVEQATWRVEEAEIALEDAPKKAIEDAERAVEDAKIAVEDAKIALEDAQIAVEDAKKAVEDAKKAVEDARKALDEALNTSPEVTAPFTGFITRVNVSGGDEVKKGTVAVTIADPNKFEADILVNEMDFLHIKLGGEARVQVDAMPGLSLSAKVAHISPTAVIQSGVVNYKVKVEVQSLEEATQERQQTEQGISSDELSEQMKQAIECCQSAKWDTFKTEHFGIIRQH